MLLFRNLNRWSFLVVSLLVLGMTQESIAEVGAPPEEEDVSVVNLTEAQYEKALKDLETVYEDTKGEAHTKIPFCEAIRRHHEKHNKLRLTKELSDKAELKKLFSDMRHSFPSYEILRTRAPRMLDGNVRPAYFHGDTPIFHVAKRTDTGFEDGTIKIKDLKPGDYVLSTTAHLFDDPSFKRDCWARVSALVTSTVKGKGAKEPLKIGIMSWEGKLDVPAEEQPTVVISLSPYLSFYTPAKAAEKTAWVRAGIRQVKLGNTEIKKIKLGDILYSPTKDLTEGNCTFASIHTEPIDDDITFYNADIELTGFYQIGGLGSQIGIVN